MSMTQFNDVDVVVGDYQNFGSREIDPGNPWPHRTSMCYDYSDASSTCQKGGDLIRQLEVEEEIHICRRGGVEIQCCFSCDQKTPFFTPQISPASSLSSYCSCTSNLGDMSNNMANNERFENAYERTESGSNMHSATSSVDLDSLQGINHGYSNSFDITSMAWYFETFDSGKIMASGSGDPTGGMQSEDDSDGTDKDTSNPINPIIRPPNVVPSFDIASNPSIYLPPLAEEDLDGEVYVDDEEDGSLPPSSSENFGSGKEKISEEHKSAIKGVIEGHYRSLVAQLLSAENLTSGEESCKDAWGDLVANLSWEAASYIRPDASGGGAMDPCQYVKIKCIECGARTDSKVVKGVVLRKNLAHKHMPTKYENPNLLLLGGSVDTSSNELSSLDSVKQAKNHLEEVVQKLKELNLNVLLVEKSVTRDAQGVLFSKEISVVTDVNRLRLERIAQCIGASVVNSLDKVTPSDLKHCDMFHVEKYIQDHGHSETPKKTKALMFFEGCPKPLGCTILLKGACREELKKVKRVLQYAIFAAYHLSLETSFLVDERATLPKAMISSTMNGSIPNKQPYSEIPAHLSCKNTESKVPNQQDISGSSIISSPLLSGIEQDVLSDISGSSIISGSFLEQDVISIGHPPMFLDILTPASFDCEAVTKEDCYSPNNESGMFQWQYPSSDFSKDKEFSTKYPSYFSTNSTASEAPISEVVLEPSFDLQSVNGEPDGQIENTAPDSHKVVATDKHSPPIEERKEQLFGPLSDSRSILVAISSRCILKGTICENRLQRIQYYGSFDKPLGRFLRDKLFDQNYRCHSCELPPVDHAYCFIHPEGRLNISLRRIENKVLPGVREGKIWIWHRCLKCPMEDGAPRANKRVAMSDAASGLSFGKFLELSFSNHAATRVASCGHLIHRDCLRFYGFGNMVACFHYSSINVLGVHLPPAQLEFNNPNEQDWLRAEVTEIAKCFEGLFSEIFDKIHQALGKFSSDASNGNTFSQELRKLMELEECLQNDRDQFEDLLNKAINRDWQPGQPVADILELNYLRKKLLSISRHWNRRLVEFSRFLKSMKTSVKSNYKLPEDLNGYAESVNSGKEVRSNVISTEDSDAVMNKITDSVLVKGEIPNDTPLTTDLRNCSTKSLVDGNVIKKTREVEKSVNTSADSEVLQRNGAVEPLKADGSSSFHNENNSSTVNGQISQSATAIGIDDSNKLENEMNVEKMSNVSVLSDTLDAAWTGDSTSAVGTTQLSSQSQGLANPSGGIKISNSCPELPAQSNLESAEPDTSSVLTRSEFSYQNLPAQDTDSSAASDMDMHTIIRSGSLDAFEDVQALKNSRLLEHFGGKLLLPMGLDKPVIAVYEDEPTSIIAYALSSKQYKAQLSDEQSEKHDLTQKDFGEKFASNASLHSLTSDGSVSGVLFEGRNNSSEGVSTSGSFGSVISGRTAYAKNMHVEVTFDDENLSVKGRYSIICYFAKQFDLLRKMCCPSERDFIQSLSRCKKWGAQGGKSKVFFAKTLDDRFIIKQVTKTELESFLQFAVIYFEYLKLAIEQGNPTCLAKILGIYQVSVKQMKSGKDVKMDVIVMENLLYGHNASQLYDLKGSLRNRYSDDSSGVLLDQNFVERMLTSPVYVGKKAKNHLERAVWNDTSFLNNIKVMDYSLLVGVDEDRQVLVVGIIDYMRQYTWDKHLETWVKASGILGGPKNEAPTVISPKEYKKRFRKAISSYFQCIPDPWSTSEVKTSSYPESTGENAEENNEDH